jgi:predicted dehydrogenase
MTRKINRRRFLQTGSASAAAAGFWLTGGVTESFAGQPGANERLNIAIIGCGGQGGGNASQPAIAGREARGNQPAIRGENIVALCDVDQARGRDVLNRYPKVPKYTDFRQMLEKQKDIQAVVVSTPDHCHFHASAMAIQRGKHVYCEKPLTHDVWEARQLKELATKHRVATQMGNMGTAANGFRAGVEVLRSGAIGEVREVHLWTNRPIWPQGNGALEARMKGNRTVPATLSWDLWLGPTADRPYNSAYLPFSWRGWWDFGTGALGDMGCHTMNLAYMGLKLGAPSAISADVAGKVDREAAPVGCTVTYEFPAREGLPACRLFWYERRRPPMEILQGIQNPRDSGCVIVGNKGKMYSGNDYGAEHRLLPEADFRDYRPPTPTLARSPGHHAEWIRACKGGAAAMSNFVDYASGLTETVLLGNLPIRVGQRITWDSAKLQATNASGAAQYVRRQYRKGWEWNA